MNIVFLIGNGFDLNLGLKTRYSDFYSHYVKQRKDDKRKYVQRFINEILNDELWSNFELAFGQYAGEFNLFNHSEYAELWKDIHTSLSTYLDSQQRYVLDRSVKPSDETKSYLAFPDKLLKKRARIDFDKLRGKMVNNIAKIDIINFNYTKTFEHIYNWTAQHMSFPVQGTYHTLNSITHIHGTTDNNMVIGVDSQKQILGPLKSVSEVQNRLIKPIVNQNTLTMREQDCASYIAKANIICIYGMSIGETDQTWWKLVTKRLESPDALAIIFAKDNTIPASMDYLSIEPRNKKIQHLLDVSESTIEQKKILQNKITVDFNSRIFETLTNFAA